MPPLPRSDLPPLATSIADAKAQQLALRARLDLTPPPAFSPRLVAGLDVSVARKSRVGFAGIVVLELPELRTVEEVAAVATVPLPYVPGYLSFRELPPLVAAWERLRVTPDALIFDGQGYAHPRRFGVACHGGMLFGVPSVGCAKSILVGTHAPLGPERFARAPLVDRGEVVGAAVRLRERTNPVFVSPGHRMDVDTAVAVVELASAGYREPETTRRAHRLVNAARRGERAPDVRG